MTGEQDDYFVTLPSAPPAQPTGTGDGLPPWSPAPATSRPDPPDGDARTMVTVLAAIGVVVIGAILALVLVGGDAAPPADPASAADAVAAPIDPALPEGHPAITEAPEVAARTSVEGYRVWALLEDGGAVRWNPCEPIRWVHDVSQAPSSAQADVSAAFARIAAATGLRFEFAGFTDEAASRDRGTYLPERYGEGRWAPVLVSWIGPGAGGVPLKDSDRAVTIPVMVSSGEVRTYVTGQVLFNAQRLELEGGFGLRDRSWGPTILHELGHLVGLDHVDDPRQLMYYLPGSGPGSLGTGDIAGLDAVGADGGCIDTPEPRLLDVTFSPTG